MRRLLLVVLGSIMAFHTAEAKRDFYVMKEVRCGVGAMCYLQDGQPLNGKLRQYYLTGVVRQENEYRDGMKNGVQQMFYPDGKQKEYAVFLNGKVHGGASFYYNSGNIEIEEQYDNGVLNGIRKGYYEDGKIKFEENYVAGVKEGTEKQYYENGKPKNELLFDHGRVVSAVCWNYDGRRQDYTAKAEEYIKLGGTPCRTIKVELM